MDRQSVVNRDHIIIDYEPCVIDYLSGRIDEPQMINFDYIFIGPHEQNIDGGNFWLGHEVVYQNSTVTIFIVE